MSDNFESLLFFKGLEKRACYVAYTINNEQPVACTIISDHPVFYMDEQIDEEEDIFSSDDLQILEEEIKDLKQKIYSLDRLSSAFAPAADSRRQEILADKEIIAGRQEIQRGERIEITKLLKTISGSRMAKFYLDFARQHGVEIKFSAEILGASYERKTGKIFINPNMVEAEKTILLARELRRHWQHRQGALLHPLFFDPDHAILVNRLQNADLAATMVRIAWELQLSGSKSAWQYIENSVLSDLGRAFSREAYLDFRTLNNGQAAAAVVENWFLSERCRIQDKNLIHQMLADYKGYVFDLEQSVKTVTPSLISALGEMPYGKNYLSAYTTTILEDPVFTEIRDRSNANFLWFIKFERTCRETEQILQEQNQDQNADRRGLPNDSVNGNNGSPQSEILPSTSPQTNDQQSKTRKTAEIVHLFADAPVGNASEKSVDKRKFTTRTGDRKPRRKRTKDRRQNGPSAQIYYLRRNSAE